MARRRGDQPVDQTRDLDLIAPAERLDNALYLAIALARVLAAVVFATLVLLFAFLLWHRSSTLA